jgi:hypothetical protein
VDSGAAARGQRLTTLLFSQPGSAYHELQSTDTNEEIMLSSSVRCTSEDIVAQWPMVFFRLISQQML